MDAYSLGIIATTCPTCGTIELFVDGELHDTISLRSSTTRDRRLVWVSNNGDEGYGLDGGSSTIVIKVASKGRPVIVDGILFDAGDGE